MNKILLIVLVYILMFSASAFAVPTNLEVFDETLVGAQVDLPNLIQITQNCSIGIEAGVEDIHYDWKDSSYGIMKLTWKGSLLDFTKK